MCLDDMGKFEEKQIRKKKTFAKNTWYIWYKQLINYKTK